MKRPGGAGGSGDVVVGSIDGHLKAFWCVIYFFLRKFTDEKELTDGPMDGPTDGPSLTKDASIMAAYTVELLREIWQKQ